jgi:hypothetical protein
MIDLNKTINNSYNINVNGAYIITIQNHESSERQAKACMASCKKVGMPAHLFYAVDGTSGELKLPKHLEKATYLSWPKVVDKYLSITEIACALSHFALWCKCVELDQPIVVLEHDAIMLKKYVRHSYYNSIVYLGCHEQAKERWPILPIPPHGTNGPNYHFIFRAAAYSIDPTVARSMVAYIVRHGIHESLDLMLRADLFSIVQEGLYAYDNYQGETTITDRKKNPEGGER